METVKPVADMMLAAPTSILGFVAFMMCGVFYLVKIFLDMDGVIADFVLAVSLVHNRPNPYQSEFGDALGKFDMHEIWKMSPREFWAPLQGTGFWSKMPKTQDADEIFAVLERFVSPLDVCILTSPNADPYCATGKFMWVKEHYPKFSRRVIITAAKHFIAHDRAILIDDKEGNCEDFERDGGRAILLPRPWNRRHSLSLDSVKVLEDELVGILFPRRSVEV